MAQPKKCDCGECQRCKHRKRMARWSRTPLGSSRPCACGCGQEVQPNKGNPTKKFAHSAGRRAIAFEDGYKVDSLLGCWVWCAAKGDHGYGTRTVDGTTVLAHRYSYEKTHGPLAPGLLVHHRCENRACVNPDHLEAVTAREHAAAHRSADLIRAIKHALSEARDEAHLRAQLKAIVTCGLRY